MFRVYLIGALVIAVALGAWHYKSTIDENKRLAKEIKAANASITVLNETAAAQGQADESKGKQIDVIDKAPQADDGPIAPVLRRTLNSVQ